MYIIQKKHIATRFGNVGVLRLGNFALPAAWRQAPSQLSGTRFPIGSELVDSRGLMVRVMVINGDKTSIYNYVDLVC